MTLRLLRSNLFIFQNQKISFLLTSNQRNLLHSRLVFDKNPIVFYEKEIILKIAITTRLGMLTTPFNLRNSTQTFQRFVTKILVRLYFVFVYIDDVIIFSGNRSKHLKHFKMMFDRSDECRLNIKIINVASVVQI